MTNSIKFCVLLLFVLLLLQYAMGLLPDMVQHRSNLHRTNRSLYKSSSSAEWNSTKLYYNETATSSTSHYTAEIIDYRCKRLLAAVSTYYYSDSSYNVYFTSYDLETGEQLSQFYQNFTFKLADKTGSRMWFTHVDMIMRLAEEPCSFFITGNYLEKGENATIKPYALPAVFEFNALRNKVMRVFTDNSTLHCTKHKIVKFNLCSSIFVSNILVTVGQ